MERQRGDANIVDEDVEPNYSTLIALGDKKGFVSIWSTKKSRPTFKLQCSESRCTGKFVNVDLNENSKFYYNFLNNNI